MTGTPANSSACKLGPTGQQVRAALTTLNAPSSFRERLLQRLVLEDEARTRGTSAAATRRSAAGGGRSARGISSDPTARG
jgi:hypothetical protein